MPEPMPLSAPITPLGMIRGPETVQLPLLMRYPFGRYQITIAVAYRRSYADGRRRMLHDVKGTEGMILRTLLNHEDKANREAPLSAAKP